MKNTGGPAFPKIQHNDYGVECGSDGMTIWDYFFTHAFSGILSELAHPKVCPMADTDVTITASYAAKCADAMIAEREKRFGGNNAT